LTITDFFNKVATATTVFCSAEEIIKKISLEKSKEIKNQKIFLQKN
jgi:hypothetical protein